MGYGQTDGMGSEVIGADYWRERAERAEAQRDKAKAAVRDWQDWNTAMVAKERQRALELRDAWRECPGSADTTVRLLDAIRDILDAHGLSLEGEGERPAEEEIALERDEWEVDDRRLFLGEPSSQALRDEAVELLTVQVTAGPDDGVVMIAADERLREIRAELERRGGGARRLDVPHADRVEDSHGHGPEME